MHRYACSWSIIESISFVLSSRLENLAEILVDNRFVSLLLSISALIKSFLSQCKENQREWKNHAYAEGFHNVAARESVFLYLREDLEDALITKDGEDSCKS